MSLITRSARVVQVRRIAGSGITSLHDGTSNAHIRFGPVSEYLATFAYADRVPGSRDYVVGVDLQQDFEHIALLVATISGEQMGNGRGRQGHLRDRALRSVASAVADWARVQIGDGQLDRLRTDSGWVEVPSSELDAKVDQETEGIALEDGSEILRFTNT